MAKTVKEAKADIFLRDTDSQSLFNNSGVLSFKYYHEWNDCYNQVTGETAQIAGEVYDETTNSYKPNCPEGFSPVFNGRLSALWDNIVNCFPNEVEAMYAKMRGNGLTYQDMLTKYKDFWKYWCENLYNADAFGYANTNNFTKAYGDKVQVMDYFYGKRQRYLDSKYHCGSSVSNNLRLRLYEVGRGFAIKHYQAIYCTLQWGVGNFYDNRNIKPGTYSYMPFKFSNPQDATFDIDDADLITELSTYAKGSNGNYTIYGLEGLGDFKFDLNMGLLKRLTKFVMNYTASKPNTRETGTSFDLSNMGMLRQVIVRNVKNLKKSIILSSDLLEEIDFTNTPIIGVTTPPTDMLTKLVLPNSIKELNLVGYTNLQARYLQVAGYSNIETLHIEDCPNLDSYEIVKTCYDAGAKLNNVTLTGIDWNIDNVEVLMFLAEKKATLRGKITIDSSVSLTAAQVSVLKQAFGNITLENNSLYISFKQNVIKAVSITGKKNLPKVGNYEYGIVTTPVTGNNIDNVQWSISENEFAEIDRNTGIVKVNKVGTVSNNDKATISVDVTLLDNTVLTAEKEVFLYPHQLSLGDYLFSDGSASDELQANLTVVAICFYINPKNRNQGLFVATRSLGAPYNAWGLYGQKSDTANAITAVELKDNPNINVYDINLIPNVNSWQIGISDANIRDKSNADNDGFKEYKDTEWGGCIGFTTVTSTMYSNIGLYLSNIGLSVGDTVSKGLVQSLYIIALRDMVLTDSGINLPVPEASNEESLYDNITKCINDFVAKNNNQKKYAQYYFPAASYSNAYEPTIKSKETLVKGLNAGNWYLPSHGEIARLCWFALKGYDGAEWAIFSNAFLQNAFVKLGGYLYSSAELPISTHICSFNADTGASSYAPGKNDVNKANFSITASIRPVVAFEIKY